LGICSSHLHPAALFHLALVPHRLDAPLAPGELRPRRCGLGLVKTRAGKSHASGTALGYALAAEALCFRTS